MASLFITRQNVPSFKEWKAGVGLTAATQSRNIGAIMGAWFPDALNNQPALKAVFKVPAGARAKFLSDGGVGKPEGPSVQFEELIVDTEVGLGGENKITGSAMMRCNLTLACPFDDFKVTFIESITHLYPDLCKAYMCKLPEKNGDERAMYMVFFKAAALNDVKLAHDLTKPTPFRHLIDDGVVKEVEVMEVELTTDVIGYSNSEISSSMPPPKVTRFDWVPEVPAAFDDNNKGGVHYKIEMWGRINGEYIAKLEAACEYLAKHQHTFSYTRHLVIESDLELVVREKRAAGVPGMPRDHLRLHASGPVVLLNGAYLGSIREFEKWANATYGYVDKTIDALYAKRARKNLAMYMEQEKDKKDFVYLDMAYTDASGNAVAITPRIIVELYKNMMPKAAFNMVTMCEDKLQGNRVHRVVSKGWVQLGAGLGDTSIFGGTFEDESFSVKHSGPGDVGMASTGPHSNACQFYISLDRLDFLDGQKMVFGRVVDGLRAVKQLGRAEVQRWNQRPVLTHFIAACGKLTAEMALDKRTALHSGVGGSAVAAAGASSGGADVLQLSDETATKEAGGGGGGNEAAVAAMPEQPDIMDINSYDDDAHKAALKMQQAGRGMLARKHAKKYLDMKFTETIADVSVEDLWDAIGDFTAPKLQAGGWYDEMKDAGENKLGSRRVVVPARGWWAGSAREETLVTRHAAKMWMSLAIVGPQDVLGKAKYTECNITWKIRAGDGGGATVVCNVRVLPKAQPEAEGGGDFSEDQIAPSFKTEFSGVCEAAVKAAKGEVAPPPETLAPPGEEAPEAEAPPAEAPPAEAPPAEAPAE